MYVENWIDGGKVAFDISVVSPNQNAIILRAAETPAAASHQKFDGRGSVYPFEATTTICGEGARAAGRAERRRIREARIDWKRADPMRRR